MRMPLIHDEETNGVYLINCEMRIKNFLLITNNIYSLILNLLITTNLSFYSNQQTTPIQIDMANCMSSKAVNQCQFSLAHTTACYPPVLPLPKLTPDLCTSSLLACQKRWQLVILFSTALKEVIASETCGVELRSKASAKGARGPRSYFATTPSP